MKNNIETIKCIICGNDNTETIKKGIDNQEFVNLVICKNCGLAYLNPRWNKQTYSDYYKSKYDEKYRSNADSIKIPPINPIIERFKEHKNLFEKQLNVLDIGCGNGENLIAIKSKYSKASLFGIEPSLNAKQILAKNDIRFIATDADMDWENAYNEYFDIVIMRHVLEHFLNPVAILQKVYKTLKKDGILYIAVPNNLNRNRLKGWARIPHTYYFNKYSLKNILNITGFDTVSIVEGDEFNKHEIFVIAYPSKEKIESIHNVEYYIEQKEVFLHVLKKEKRIIYKLKKLLLKLTH